MKCVEFHTGKISRKIKANKNFKNDLKNFIKCVNYATSIGIEVHAGHGLTFETARVISRINVLKELNIGHFLISESVLCGLEAAITQMRHKMWVYRYPDTDEH